MKIKRRRTKLTDRRCRNYPHKLMAPDVNCSSVFKLHNVETIAGFGINISAGELEMDSIFDITASEVDAAMSASNETCKKESHSNELELDVGIPCGEWDETIELFQDILNADQSINLDLNLSAMEWDLTSLELDQVQVSSESCPTFKELDLLATTDFTQKTELLQQPVIQFQTSAPTLPEYFLNDVAPCGDQSKPSTHSHDKVKPRKANQRSDAKKTKEDLIVLNGTPYWEVEYVHDKRKRGGIEEYLVKWKGYKKDESTWEPITSFQTLECIIQFESQRWILQQKACNNTEENK